MQVERRWGLTMPEETNGGVLRFKVDKHERDLERLHDWRSKVDEERTTVRGELQQLHRDMTSLERACQTGLREQVDKVDSLRKTLIGLLATIATSALVFSLSVLLATGKL